MLLSLVFSCGDVYYAAQGSFFFKLLIFLFYSACTHFEKAFILLDVMWVDEHLID